MPGLQAVARRSQMGSLEEGRTGAGTVAPPYSQISHWQIEGRGQMTEKKPKDKCSLVADAIKGIISQGIDLSDDVVHYIDSTFSNPTLGELEAILADLDESKREVFVMVEVLEMTVPEVVQALEIPLNTAYSRLRLARKLFEEALARHEAADGEKR